MATRRASWTPCMSMLMRRNDQQPAFPPRPVRGASLLENNTTRQHSTPTHHARASRLLLDYVFKFSNVCRDCEASAVYSRCWESVAGKARLAPPECRRRVLSAPQEYDAFYTPGARYRYSVFVGACLTVLSFLTVPCNVLIVYGRSCCYLYR